MRSGFNEGVPTGGIPHPPTAQPSPEPGFGPEDGSIGIGSRICGSRRGARRRRELGARGAERPTQVVSQSSGGRRLKTELRESTLDEDGKRTGPKGKGGLRGVGGV